MEAVTRQHSMRAVGLLFIVMAVISWLLVELLTPAEELTRFRNALLIDTGSRGDFSWAPDRIPDDFHYESTDPPVEFETGAPKLPIPVDAVDAMTTLVVHLRTKPKRRGPIKSSTVVAYQTIVNTGRGYCADYTQVFNGLAHSVSLPVREWGMSFDRFNGDGHAFNEVFDADKGKWLFVDPMNAFYVQDADTNMPLSVLEFRERLALDSGFDTVDIVPIGDKFLFGSDRDAFAYYANGANQFFLWFGNDVFSYDAHPVVRLFGPISRALEQLIAIGAGIHPRIRVFPTGNNEEEIRNLMVFRNLVSGLLITWIVVALAILRALVLHLADRSRQ